MKFIHLRHLILLLGIVLLGSCSGNKNNGNNQELFTFDKTSIGIEVSDSDLGIKYNPPKDWELMPSSLSKKMEMRSNPSDGFIYQPVYVFFNKSTGSLLSCGKVNSTDSLASNSSVLNFYKGLLTSKYKNSNLVLNTFVHSKIAFNQIKFDKENLTSYKLFFQNNDGEIIQLEYSFRKETLEIVSSSIKASIGSIRLLN